LVIGPWSFAIGSCFVRSFAPWRLCESILFSIILCAAAVADDRPNIIVLFADDLGYGDLGCFGATEIETPQLDRMAKEGRRFTDFYSAGPTCTPSRAGLLTGCYPARVGFGDQIGRMAGGGASRGRVLHSGAAEGLNPDEITVAELLKAAGYATGMIGKWHLGEATKFNPTNHGFDEFFGVHYSNDMKPYEYYRGTERLPEEIDRDNQIRRYTEEALAFIRKHRDGPFFLYFAHAMPHTPLAASQQFRGRSKRGLYGDAVMEVDWSAGQILGALRELDLDQRTLVIFTSDNGPWLARGEHGGSAGPLRAGKGTTYEGGVREPCIMWQPGTIPADTVCREVASAMDLLPTFAALAGTKPPSDRTIDGHDIRPLMTGDDAKSPWEALYFYFGNELHAVRSGRWKFRAKNNLVNENIYYREASTKVAIPPALYDLARDPGEQKSVLQDHPEVAKRLRGYMDQARADLGDSLRHIPPTNARPVGQADGAP
jgi:arylsulfatase A-like enzyme